MLNVITIHGRLTRDPELRYTQSQVPVASFTVAVDRDFTSDSGERGVDFIDCVAWRATGEFVNKYFQKGSLIVVSGRLQSRKWTDKEGNKRVSWEINANNVYFGGSKSDNQGAASSQQSGYGAAPAQQGGYQQPRTTGGAVNAYPGPEFQDLDDSDGELPF